MKSTMEDSLLMAEQTSVFGHIVKVNTPRLPTQSCTRRDSYSMKKPFHSNLTACTILIVVNKM